MPEPSDLNRSNWANEQIREPHIPRTDSERSSQLSLKKRPADNLAFPRVDLHSPAARTHAEYLGPRQGLQNSMVSTENDKLSPLRRLPVPHDVRRNDGTDGQRKAPHLHRQESDRLPYRPPASTTTLNR
jgi:hypothetical protein